MAIHKIILVCLCLLFLETAVLAAEAVTAAPAELQKRCQKALSLCVRSQQVSDGNYTPALDRCWEQLQGCPQNCIDEYAARRKSGVSALDANPLIWGRFYEMSSCILGMDEIKFPGRKLLPADSKLYLTLEGSGKGKKIEAIVVVKPLDANDYLAVTPENPSRQAHYEAAPLLMPLPAGRYRVYASPRGAYSGYREPTYIFTLKKGQSLRKVLKLHSATDKIAQGVGILHLLGPSDKNPVRYTFASAYDSNGVSNRKVLPRSEVARVRRDFSLPSGRYTLLLRPQNYYGGEIRKVVTLGAGEEVNLPVAFLQPGQLRVEVNGLVAGQQVKLNIWQPGPPRRAVATIGPQRPPFEIKLAPGSYTAGLSVQRSEQIYGREQEQLLEPFVVTAGGRQNRQVTVAPQNWGILNLNALYGGLPAKVNVRVSLSSQPSFVIYPRGARRNGKQQMPLQIKLLEGDYLLSLWGEAPNEDHIFPYPTFERKNIPLSIKGGKALAETLKFEKPSPSTLVLTVLLNGVPTKARLWGRKAGTDEPFALIGASYNLLTNNANMLPGRYDIKAHPMVPKLSLGIDVFHGRTSAPLTPVLSSSTKPKILEDVEITADGSVMKMMSFKSSNE